MNTKTRRHSPLFMIGFALMALTLNPATRPLRAAPVVENPETPLHGVETLALSEIWRVGADNDDLFFGLIVQALLGPDGHYYFLDSQLSEVTVFSADGDHLRTIGREGEGPGEIRRAGTMLVMPDGAIGVVQRFPGKLVLITPDGLPAGVVIPGDPTSGGREYLGDVKAFGGELLMSGGRNTRSETARLRHNYLGRFNLDGELLHEYYTRDDVYDFNARSFGEGDDYFIHDGRWDAGPDGTLYAAIERDAYSLAVYAPEGPQTMTINRAGPLWKRPKALKQKIEDRWKATRRYQRFQTEQVIADAEPAISRVVVHDHEIRVLPATGQHDQPDGVLQTWDIFTSEGVFDHQLAVACPGDGTRDMLFFLGDDRVIVVAGYQDAMDALRGVGSEDDVDEGEATPVEIIAYAIH